MTDTERERIKAICEVANVKDIDDLEDGELCFGGGWFIVGIDTPEGSYTYHYEDNYYSLFECKELERGKHWDGHTEKDVTRLLSLPSAQPDFDTDQKMNKAYDDGYDQGYLQCKMDQERTIGHWIEH